jgi:hypothetical protein
MGKKAIITVELVDESVAYSSSKIAEELCRWFREESLPPPWVKEVEKVVVQES